MFKCTQSAEISAIEKEERTTEHFSRQFLIDDIEHNQIGYSQISDCIWEYAETAYQEVKSADLLSRELEKNGFIVTRGIADIPTAFKAVCGYGAPRIAILGEYDALPGLSQKAGLAHEEQDSQRTTGHGCGHHLLGTAGVAAAIAVKNLLVQGGRSGTIEFYGCPAEEGGSGKSFMAKAGCFNGLDAVLTWHPYPMTGIMNVTTLANCKATYTFKGIASHAALSPHLGRSALDAAELMNVGANFLREHIIPEARLHYAFSDAGGTAPNVVPALAKVVYMVRAPRLEQVQEIYARLNLVAQGAATMTQTEVEIHLDKTCANMIPNTALEQVLYAHMCEIEPPKPGERDLSFAHEIAETLSKKPAGALLPDRILPFDGTHMAAPASTDVGDVSWNVPTAQLCVSCYAAGTPEHSWQLVAQGKSEWAHKGMLYAAKVLAASTVQLIDSPAILKTAKEELEKSLQGTDYRTVCDIFESGH